MSVSEKVSFAFKRGEYSTGITLPRFAAKHLGIKPRDEIKIKTANLKGRKIIIIENHTKD